MLLSLQGKKKRMGYTDRVWFECVCMSVPECACVRERTCMSVCCVHVCDTCVHERACEYVGAVCTCVSVWCVCANVCMCSACLWVSRCPRVSVGCAPVRAVLAWSVVSWGLASAQGPSSA